MQFHASLPPPLFGRRPVRDDKDKRQGDFRHMFADDDKMVPFAGYGKGHEDKTRRMLERLAVRITKEGEAGGAIDNHRVPAGYTYFAQMVGHDIVHSVPGEIEVTEAQPLTRNIRAARLILDTIYGRSPSTSPESYAVPKWNGQPRTRLRLGKCRLEGARPAGGPALDIPRTQCPHLDNRQDRGATEALLADPRGDVSLVLSQMTVLFHLLHNRAEAKIAWHDERSGAPERDRAARRFARARKATATAFRTIVEKDLMPRLLCKETHDRLKQAMKTGHFLDMTDDERITIEFAHAAYRFGHSMVRSTYALNDRQRFTGLKDVVRFTSSRRPYAMPLSSDWLVRWSNFFDMSKRKPNFSAKLQPAVAPALGVNDLFATQDDVYGGLVQQDLVRGADAGQWSADSLIGKLPRKEKTDPFLTDPAERAQRIERWLRKRSSAEGDDPGFDEKDIALLSTDPPLLFFIMMEAWETQRGKCLGPVGSMIVGETVFAALYRTRPLVEDDDDAKDAVKIVFGRKPPKSMPDLIRYLESTGDLPGE